MTTSRERAREIAQRMADDGMFRFDENDDAEYRRLVINNVVRDYLNPLLAEKEAGGYLRGLRDARTTAYRAVKDGCYGEQVAEAVSALAFEAAAGDEK